MPRAACAFPPALLTELHTPAGIRFPCEYLSRWHFRQHHVWDPTPLSRKGEAHKLLLFCYPSFPFRGGSQCVSFCTCKKQHSFFDDNAAPQSAASKRSRKYRATLQNTSSGNTKILHLHFWLYQYLPMGNIIGGLQCWGISMPAADLARRKCGWCATSMSCEFCVPSQSPAFVQQEAETRYSVHGVMCARVKMSKKAESPIYFHLFHYLGGRRSLWMNCLKDGFHRIIES